MPACLQPSSSVVSLIHTLKLVSRADALVPLNNNFTFRIRQLAVLIVIQSALAALLDARTCQISKKVHITHGVCVCSKVAVK